MKRNRLAVAFGWVAVAVLVPVAPQSAFSSVPPSVASLERAAAVEFAPFLFVHTADPELGSADLAGRVKRFGQLAERANAMGAALVVIAGDLVHDGSDARGLKTLDEGLTAFKMPVRAVPGNHDDLAAFRKRFGQENVVFTFHNCDFVCLDSNDLSVATLGWLEDVLVTAARRHRAHLFVVMHHPPRDKTTIDGLFARHKVAAVLCGHLHETGSVLRGTYTTYWVSGTAKVRDNKGLRYNVFKVHKDRIEQQSLPLDKEVSKTLAAPSSAVP